MRPSLLRRPGGRALTAGLLVGAGVLSWASLGPAQEALPWARGGQQPRYEDPAPPPQPNDAYQPRYGSPRAGGESDAYRPPPRSDAYQGGGGYPPPPAYGGAPPTYAGPPS